MTLLFSMNLGMAWGSINVVYMVVEGRLVIVRQVEEELQITPLVREHLVVTRLVEEELRLV